MVVSEILSHGPKEAGAGYSPHPGECVCVPVYLCDNGQIVTDGAGIIDIRQLPPRKGTFPSRKKKRVVMILINWFVNVEHNCVGVPRV